MIFRFYAVYKKQDDDKNWQPNHRKDISIIASTGIMLPQTVFHKYWEIQQKISYYHIQSAKKVFEHLR